MLVGSSARRVAIVGGIRIPFARSMGPYAEASNQEMLTATLKALVDRYALQGEVLGDVGAGAVLKHSRDYSLTRECVVDSGLALETPAYDLQRACGTSLDTVVGIGLKIAVGQIQAGIGAGVDTASDVPIVYSQRFRRILLASARGRTFSQPRQFSGSSTGERKRRDQRSQDPTVRPYPRGQARPFVALPQLVSQVYARGSHRRDWRLCGCLRT